MASTTRPKETNNQNEIVRLETSICQFLRTVDLIPFYRYIESACYKPGQHGFRFDPLLMLKLVIVQLYRDLPYRKVSSSLSEEDCTYLKVPKDHDGYILPAASTLHHFVKYRLKEEGINRLMEIAGRLICQVSPSTDAIIDSTPVEASRYDQYAAYNPHYESKMYKAHIIHLGDCPLYCCFSGGNDADSTYAPTLIRAAKTMNPHIDRVFADAGYDSFEIHADIWYQLDARPFIDYRETAVFHKEGTEKRIDHWVNKLWKLGGNIHAPLKEKLRFLYKHDRSEQVGMYWRNVNLRDTKFDEVYRKRTDCERTHSHLKALFKFDVRHVRDASKRLYVLLNFVAYQIVLLGNLQNNVHKVKQFSLIH